MARKTGSIKITPKLIELDDRIVRVPNIASVTIGPDPTRRRWAIIIGLFSLSTLYGSTRLFNLASDYYDGRSEASAIYFWAFVVTLIGLAGLALAIYLFLYQALFISTSDGRFTVLIDQKAAFMREVMARIREALLAGEASQIVYQVNVQAERIERLDANSTVVSNSAGAIVAGGSMTSGAHPAGMGLNGSAGHAGSHVMAASAGGGQGSLTEMLSRAREHMGPLAQQAAQAATDMARRGRSMAEERIAALRGGGRDGGEAGSVSANVVNVSGAQGAFVAGGGMNIADSRISTQVSIVGDFDAVMDVLHRQNAAHKDEILEYLRPVRDHLAGGATPREEAKTRWAWFAAQAASALTGIDGVLAIVERVSRVLGIAR